jgi:hypothetical protein
MVPGGITVARLIARAGAFLMEGAKAAKLPLNLQARGVGETACFQPPETPPFVLSAARASCYPIPSVKAKSAIAMGVCGLLGGALWYFLSRPAELPRIRLPDGGEFRVVQVKFTPNSSVDGHEHNLGPAPAYRFTLWRLLPKSLQSRIPYPSTGIGGQSSYHPAISIWWAYIDPKTGKPALGPTDYVVMILDDGEQRKYDWPEPAEGGYRQIWVDDPPTTSRHLRFRLSAEDQPVDFTIENPAYKR